jgi:SAM-dependent methyltransferase
MCAGRIAAPSIPQKVDPANCTERIYDDMDEYIRALIDLHHGVGREGPGDATFSRQILAELPTLPPKPRIVDLGCGSGAGALLLAEHFGVPVAAVDLAQPFLDAMMEQARARGLADRIHPLACDFADLPMEPGSVDLLWSEGAAYNLTFAGALQKWRSLLASNGVAVISELSWFSGDVPDEARRYWKEAYPAIGDEAENIARAQTAGFDVRNTHRLPAQAWWDNYYDPMLKRIAAMSNPDSTMQAVIAEMQTEIDLFRQYSQYYGYTFYVLTASSATA